MNGWYTTGPERLAGLQQPLQQASNDRTVRRVASHDRFARAHIARHVIDL